MDCIINCPLMKHFIWFILFAWMDFRDIPVRPGGALFQPLLLSLCIALPLSKFGHVNLLTYWAHEVTSFLSWWFDRSHSLEQHCLGIAYSVIVLFLVNQPLFPTFRYIRIRKVMQVFGNIFIMWNTFFDDLLRCVATYGSRAMDQDVGHLDV